MSDTAFDPRADSEYEDSSSDADRAASSQKLETSQGPDTISKGSSFGESVPLSSGLSQFISDVDLRSRPIHSSTQKPKRRTFFSSKKRKYGAKAKGYGPKPMKRCKKLAVESPEDFFVHEHTPEIISPIPMSLSKSSSDNSDSNDPTDFFTKTASTVPPTDTFLVPTSSLSIPTAASKISTKPPKKPRSCELLSVYDSKTNVEKCVKLSRISNQRIVIDVAILELMFSGFS